MDIESLILNIGLFILVYEKLVVKAGTLSPLEGKNILGGGEIEIGKFQFRLITTSVCYIGVISRHLLRYLPTKLNDMPKMRLNSWELIFTLFI